MDVVHSNDSNLIMKRIASNSKIIEECLGELKDLEKRVVTGPAEISAK